MADIFCPTCGKPNPDTLDTCKHCGSLLHASSSGSLTPNDGDLPDWLKALQPSGEEATSPEEASSAEEPLGGDLPDWLSQMGEPPASTGPATSAKPDEDLPDWLKNYSMGEPGEASQAAQPAEELPDWLAGFADAPIEESEPEGVQEIPDWLNNFTQAAPPPTTSAPAESPDWLSELEGVGMEDELALPAMESSTGTPPPETVSTPAGGDELPDWLSELSDSSLDIPAAPESPVNADLEDWLGSTPGATPAFTGFDLEDTTNFLEAELPDWLSDPGGTGVPAQADAEAPGSDLSPADLPDWLRAMRPEDGGRPMLGRETIEGEMERAGPLAGLRDLLPAEPEITRAGKPPLHSLKLHVTEKQQKNAELLYRLLDAEQRPRPAKPVTRFTPQRIVRWIIALGLLLAVLAPILGQTQAIPLPFAMTAETQHVFNQVSALPVGAPVLLAFDYEPGLSGELDAAAAALVDHLGSQQANLALVSTSPIGPALGEAFMKRILPEYQAGEQYTNLGYISGGMSGLQSFALLPKLTTSGAYDDASLLEVFSGAGSVWSQAPVANINRLSDFEMAVVITDDPETARFWIEQVQPDLKPGSLSMVISAQIEPLVRPFTQGNTPQVYGLITGLAGGASYEGALGRGNLSRSYWDAFGFGMLMAQLLLIVGGIYNLSSVWFEKRRKTRKPEVRPAAPRPARRPSAEEKK